MTEFLTDFIANYEVEVAGLSARPGGGKDRVCGECGGPGPVAHFCSDCRSYLCGECQQQHKRLRALRGHSVVPISGMNVAALQSCQVQYCSLHNGEILKLYCETCTKLVCRDCTLVEHRQHSYKFVHDARKQIEAELASLESDVEKKLAPFKHDLEEIKKVEKSVGGHSRVVTADINSFFDSLIQSLKDRRKVLLHEAENACQKDLKQIWADKNFHEATISHISAVFRLAAKARKCTSDSEMILTAMQGINQLKIIKEKEWDRTAFVKVVSSAPHFEKTNTIAVKKLGNISRVTGSGEIRLINNSAQCAALNNCFQINVSCSPIKTLVNSRSRKPVNLQKKVQSHELEVVVQYGRAKKELNRSYITVQDNIQGMQLLGGYATGAYPAHQPLPRFGATTNPYGTNTTRTATPGTEETDKSYAVSIRFVCGGTHTAIFRYGYYELTHTFTVQGQPQHGQQVRKGPDWTPGSGIVNVSAQRRSPKLHYAPHNAYGYSQPFDSGVRSGTGVAEDHIGTVHVILSMFVNQNDMVTVLNQSGGYVDYKWGKDGEYEIEINC